MLGSATTHTREAFDLFDYLTRIRHSGLAQHTGYVTLGKGETIYQPADNMTVVYEILAGAVKIGSYSRKGDEFVYEVLKEGDILGNLHYLDGQFQEFAKAVTSVRLRTYQLAFFRHIITHNPAVAEWFQINTVRRWCRMETRFFTTGTQEVGARIAALQAELSKEISDATGRKHRLFHLLTQKDIANLTGTTRQTVAIVLRELAAG